MKVFKTTITILVAGICPYCGERLEIGNADTGDFLRDILEWQNVQNTFICDNCGKESKKPQRVSKKQVD